MPMAAAAITTAIIDSPVGDVTKSDAPIPDWATVTVWVNIRVAPSLSVTVNVTV